MDALLIKIFATGLALSQVATQPDSLSDQFDRTADQQQVVSILRSGCAHLRKAFGIEDINIDELLETAMEDPDAVAGTNIMFRGINFKDLEKAYRQFCRNEALDKSSFDIGA